MSPPYPLPYMQPPKYGYPLPSLPYYPEQRAGSVQPEYKLAYVIEYKPTYPEHPPPTISYTSTNPEQPSANQQQQQPA